MKHHENKQFLDVSQEKIEKCRKTAKMMENDQLMKKKAKVDGKKGK
jgi:hypothetical protein